MITKNNILSFYDFYKDYLPKNVTLDSLVNYQIINPTSIDYPNYKPEGKTINYQFINNNKPETLILFFYPHTFMNWNTLFLDYILKRYNILIIDGNKYFFTDEYEYDEESIKNEILPLIQNLPGKVYSIVWCFATQFYSSVLEYLPNKIFISPMIRKSKNSHFIDPNIPGFDSRNLNWEICFLFFLNQFPTSNIIYNFQPEYFNNKMYRTVFNKFINPTINSDVLKNSIMWQVPNDPICINEDSCPELFGKVVNIENGMSNHIILLKIPPFFDKPFNEARKFFDKK
jgi:hypothetical protein